MADFEFESLVLELEVALPRPQQDTAASRLPAFEDLVAELYPHGRAWDTSPGTTTHLVLQSLAAALVEVELQSDRFMAETDPSRTLQLLAEWERALGLPDPCLGTDPTPEERRASIVAKLYGLLSVSTPDLLAWLAGLGYTVTLQHFQPFKVGISTAGLPLYGIPWQFAFAVHYWGSGDRAVLECTLPHRLPAHVTVVFFYGEFNVADVSLDFVVPPISSIT